MFCSYLTRRASVQSALCAASFFAVVTCLAEPFIAPGDVWLRDDLQRLSDAGVITSPITSWPISVGDIAEDINAFGDEVIEDPAVLEAFERLRLHLGAEMGTGELDWEVASRLTERPQRIRSFRDVGRGRFDFRMAATTTGQRFAARLQGNLQRDDPADGDSARLDGSYFSLALGNWLVSASAQDRFWGPGWDGALLLSNSARPVPALTLQRNFSTPFESRWLRWIGPWSTSMVWGQLESTRGVPNARLFAWRVNARPLRGLEVGVQRAIQWCGSDRDCSADAFFRSIAGDSNLDEGVTNDVSNQIAGFDARWASPVGGLPYAVYGQFVGEDEAGGFPSKYLGQFGFEVWGRLAAFAANWRLHVEYSDTTCQFNEASSIFNCAYNNSSYPSGYRYRGRSIGHGADNDARALSVGLVTRVKDREAGFSMRRVELNRGGPPDAVQSITATPEDQFDVDVFYRASLDNDVELDLSVGVVRVESALGDDRTDIRGSIGLRFSTR